MDITRLSVADLKPGQRIEVVNLDNGEIMDRVTDFDAEGGWLLRFKIDEQGSYVVSADGKRCVQEAVLGRFFGREII